MLDILLGKAGLFSSFYHHCLEYAYNREVSITADNVYELLPAADQFNIDGIVFKCSKFLEESLTPQNCIGLRYSDLLEFSR